MARKDRGGSSDDPRALLRGAHLVEPPEGTVRRAVALGERLRRPVDGVVGWVVRRLFDSAAAAAPAGVRGAGSERRMLYEIVPAGSAESRQLDLRIRHEGRGTRGLIGQILPPIPDARVTVGRRSAVCDETGEFELAGLPGKGGLTLRIDAPGAPAITVDEVAADPPGPEVR